MSHLFIKNKYTKWYYDIINNAKLRINESYIEKHHIIPKALGGVDDSNNLVELTPKEHYVVHLLLCKMTNGQARYKMAFALHCMSNLRPNERYTSKLYAYHKHMFRKAMSKIQKGKPKSEETKRKMSAAFRHSEKRSIAARKNFQKAAQMNKGISRPEHLKKQWSEKRKGEVKSEETKRRMSKSAKERSKIKACCHKCHKELPVNSLASHWRFC